MMRLSSEIVRMVNSQRSVDQKTREVILPRGRRAELAEVARLIADRHLAYGTLAEISVRLPGERVGISGEGTWFARAREEDFTVTGLHNDQLFIENPLPAFHASWHRLIYQLTPADAVLLCQPRSAVRASRMVVSLDPNLLPDASRVAGNVGWADPDPDSISRAVASSRAICIAGIGLLVWGNDLYSTAALAETIDLLLQMHLVSISK